MASQPFLTVDEQPISLAQAIQYLQLSGKLQPFIGDILRRYILERELETRSDISVEQTLVEQAVVDFRLQRQLTELHRFEEWLANNSIDYVSFHKQIAFTLKLAKLKNAIAQPKLEEYFHQRQIFLDRVFLYRIVVKDRSLAESLYSQIQAGGSFEKLAREYSITEDRILNGIMGPVSRGILPDTLRAAVDSANPGDSIGPFQIEGNWCLFRVEVFLPASLENSQLRETLQNEIFELWLAEKLNNLNVKVQTG